MLRHLVVLLAFFASLAHAQTAASPPYPSKLIRVVVPWPAGGTTDIVGRLVAQKLNEAWGQPVIVDNRPGGSGTIGSELVAKSSPDGYTLLVASMGTLTMNQFLSKLNYDPANDLTPITLLPGEALDPIHVAFTDTLGVAIAGASDPAPRLLSGIVAPCGDEATLLGGHGRASALDAAWINGTAAHALDYDDVSQRGIGHASAVLVPAILAEAEALGASGKQMMAAYAAGYETIAELARRDADIGRYHEKGWHPTPVFGAIAAAAACASLRGLNAERCAHAVTNARGDHELPLRSADVWEKFEDCLKYGAARAPARELFETLMSLERVRNARELMALLVGLRPPLRVGSR